MSDSNLNIRAKALMEIRQEIKILKEEEDALRGSIVEEAQAEWEGREHLLPTTTITIPRIFWETIPKKFSTLDDFLESRFPTWDLIHLEEDNVNGSATFILRKRPEFMAFAYEDNFVKVSKVSVEPTPEIDQETLKAEKPELYDKLYKPVTVMELDEQALSDAIEEDAEVPSILMRHQFTARAPQQRISASEVKK